VVDGTKYSYVALQRAAKDFPRSGEVELSLGRPAGAPGERWTASSDAAGRKARRCRVRTSMASLATEAARRIASTAPTLTVEPGFALFPTVRLARGAPELKRRPMPDGRVVNRVLAGARATVLVNPSPPTVDGRSSTDAPPQVDPLMQREVSNDSSAPLERPRPIAGEFLGRRAFRDGFARALTFVGRAAGLGRCRSIRVHVMW